MENGDVELRRQNIIGHTVQLLLDCKEKGRIRKLQSQPSIRMVPNALRALSPNSFNPRVVSIGPLHKEDKILQDFEDEKAIYLHEFLDLLPEQTLQACVQKVSDSIEKIKACYAGMMKFDDTELTKMMVMDGCFILHFCYKVLVGYTSLRNNNGAKTMHCLFSDLLLVENQIPYFVLEDIFQYTILKFRPTMSLTHLIRPILMSFTFLDPENLSDFRLVDRCDDHILGLVHKSNRLAFYNLPRNSNIPKFHSVTELDRAGVSFKPNKDATSPMAMKLEFSRFSVRHPWSWGKPTLSMPVICIQDKTEIVLRNLIAYEASLLVESKIVDNVLASNERAANMLKAICKETVIVDFFYNNEWQQLHKYCNGYWPKQIAGLKRTYFSNPLSMIALFAGIVLFLLTLIQTIFTVEDIVDTGNNVARLISYLQGKGATSVSVCTLLARGSHQFPGSHPVSLETGLVS
ncbi:hypothetical protein CTI12_AA580810 [Artemisia annua]|uniref:Uncharacterized protein n=1 Tax=Artemisia annua TaxID=35608 RepID=A0A2U1KPM7_ARTAN|nr:hypothetical protein CTI12_AA580810 [Artemisia annua]